MHASSALLALALAVLATTATAKVYTRCELATELKNKHGFTRSELPDWLCLVQYESSYNTTARHVNGGKRPSVDLGLFQINDSYWCDKSSLDNNDCNLSCSVRATSLAVLTDNDITDDVKCARKVHARQGFGAWAAWKKNCEGKNLSSFLKDCNV